MEDSDDRKSYKKCSRQENIIMFVIIIILLPKCCLIFAKFATICSIIVIFQHSNTVIVFLLIPQSLSRDSLPLYNVCACILI